MSDRFEWDDGNWPKCGAHGLSQGEIEDVFRNEPDVFPDAAHSAVEVRYLAIGRNAAGRHVFVAFTLRDLDGVRAVRPISARYMHREEIDHYERGKKENS